TLFRSRKTLDCPSKSKRIFLRTGPDNGQIVVGDVVRKSDLEYFEGRGRQTGGRERGRADARREPRVSGCRRSDELDVAFVRPANETVLRNGARAVRHFCYGTTAV